MKKVIAIDPGVTTGYCYARIADGKIEYAPFQMFDDVADLWVRLYTFKPDHIVCESFEFRGGARRGLDLTPMKLIGIVELYSLREHPAPTVHMQNAATGKGYYSDSVLKSLGLYVRGIGHAMDASRHLLQWFTFGYGHQFQGGDTDFARLVSLESFE